LFSRQQKQIAHLAKPDIRTRPTRKVDVGVQASLGKRDVDGIGELCPHAAGGAATRAGTKLPPLDQDNVVHSRLGHVECSAHADNAATDDYDAGGVRKDAG
jgi:hypothetical protein